MNIHDLVEAWHTGPDLRPLHVYLGMSREQYAKWVEGRMTTDELRDLGYTED